MDDFFAAECAWSSNDAAIASCRTCCSVLVLSMIDRHPLVRMACCMGVSALCMWSIAAASAATNDAPKGKNDPPQGKALPLQARLWADETLLGSPVALSIDAQGRAYVAQSVRRKESELDIRSHEDWVVPTLSFESVADRQHFYEQQLSSERSAVNRTWLKDRNGDGVADFRDLGVLSEKILLLEDRAGKGQADHSRVFADGMNRPMTGVAAGVLVWDDQVYVTAIPDLLKLPTDRHQSAIDAEKDVLLTGFGVHIAYSGHDMHGLAKGLDGRLYWSIGDKGLNVRLADGRVVKNAHSGAVLRCETDGSGFEVFASGLRNPQEIAFDAWGNLFAVDNDGDFKGERERMVYITEQSDAGWRCNWQYRKGDYNPWMDEKLCFPSFAGQAAYITPPLALYSDGPSGFVYNPGTALGESLREHFFVTQFPRRKLSAFRLEPQGASFRMIGERLVYGGVMMTGLSWGPDGCLYVADWNNTSWEPHERGKIWQLDVAPAERDARRAETAQWLARGAAACAVGELEQALAHPDQRVRLLAQMELAKRRETAVLLRVATGGKELLARVHAIWGLGQLGRRDAAVLRPLQPLFADQQAETRAQVCKVFGDAPEVLAVPELGRCLSDASPRVRFHAALALAKRGDASVAPSLVAAVVKNGTEDVHLRHALMAAMAGCGMDLLSLQNHSVESVRLAAVVALRRRGDAQVARFLHDASPIVAREAARAIHDDDSMPSALPLLAGLLPDQRGEDEVLLRRAISACLRGGEAQGLMRLGSYAARQDAPEAMRVEALESLRCATLGLPLDRVEGRYRGVKAVAPELVAKVMQAVASQLMQDRSPLVRRATCEVLAASAWQDGAALLLRALQQAQEVESVQTAAYDAMVKLRASALPEASRLALASRFASLRDLALQQLALSAHGLESALPLLTQLLENGGLPEQQRALAILAKVDNAEVVSLLKKWWSKLQAGTVPEGLRLDVIEAVRMRGDASLRAELEVEEQRRSQSGVSALYRDARYGGDAARGKKVAMEHLAAQCTRCHRLGGEGAEVGPDLSKVATRLTRDELWQSLIDPSATIAAGYGIVQLQLKDGSSVSGTMMRESADRVVVRGSDGAERDIPVASIQQRSQVPSVMPPMGSLLSTSELRDVVEYLTTLK